ncbi:MAG: hypothetical protein EXS35_02560 [Pedosphaera sp.]|nr:hypothetical protein [Pedosphaera sp.]
MKTILRFCGVLLAAAFVAPFPSRAADNYVGAATVLQKLTEAASPGAKPKNETSTTALLKNDADAFKKQAAGLKPEEAAQAWLALLDRQMNLTPADLRSVSERPGNKDAFNPQNIWNALPSPAAWDALRKIIEARPPAKGKAQAREQALRLFAHTLVNDRAAQNKDVAELEAVFAKLSDDESYALAGTLDRIGEVMMANTDDTNATMKMLERRLARLAGQNYQQELSVPDLVALVGKEKAEAFLRRAVVKANVEIKVEQGEETQKLARKLALELMEQLKTPQWKLAHSLEAGALYEALEKKFATVEETVTNAPAEPGVPSLDHRRLLNRGYGSEQQAQTYYFLGLIASGRTKDAVAHAQKLGRGDEAYLPADALKSLERAGHTRAIHDFFRELISKNPDLPFWDEYIQLAAKVGETDKMLELARAAAARDDLSNRRRSLIRQNLYRALLAADQVEEGIKEIRQTLGSKDVKLARPYQAESAERGGLALTLVELGRLLNRPELVEEGLRLSREAIADKSAPPGYNSSGTQVRLAKVLADLGRGPEAEAVLVEVLTSAVQNKPQDSYPNSGESVAALTALAELYHQAGRHADVLLLLDQSPDWGAKDLKAVRAGGFGDFGRGGHEDPPSFKLSQIVASSLLAAGRKDEARKIVADLLDTAGGFDPAYELLIKIGGDDLVARLDALFARDQFEERPLIWKAYLLKLDGKLEPAEAAARRAISIDPSDGEQGPGRRMRAYAVLADIREMLGDQKQADFFRGAVKAIRLSEDADRFYEAGLLKQAVKMYENSLTHFADAYCIQSRLALRLSELGLHEAAEEHYRRAYELMPDSFGRVESHCFGCERAFDGERAQGIADKVFTRLVQNTPEKPQVHYLLGFLREEQGRYPEALARYRAAVKLDADYLNAWKKIQEVGSRHRLAATDKDAVALNLLRLDPFGRHGGSGNLGDVTNLRALWNAVETAVKNQPPPVESLYPLAASKAKLEKAENEPKGRGGFRHGGEYFDDDYSGVYRSERRLHPATAILQNNLIAAAHAILADNNGQFMDE